MLPLSLMGIPSSLLDVLEHKFHMQNSLEIGFSKCPQMGYLLNSQAAPTF